MLSPNRKDVAITHESEVSYILSKYNQDFIYNTVSESLANRIRYYDSKFPNLVSSLEDGFNINKMEYNNLQCIEDTRIEVYEQVIKHICNYYNMTFDDSLLLIPNIYISALYMYEFFISSFQDNISSFFINYIMKEKNSIYDAFSLNDKKKQKDASTIYTKKSIKNQKLAIICANLDFIVDNICISFDISLGDYIDIVYGNNTEISKHLKSVLTPNIDFFKVYIGNLFAGPFRSILLTDIRLKLQSHIMSESDIKNYIREEN